MIISIKGFDYTHYDMLHKVLRLSIVATVVEFFRESGEIQPGIICRSTFFTSCTVLDSMKPNWLHFSLKKLIQNWQFLAKKGFKLHNN